MNVSLGNFVRSSVESQLGADIGAATRMAVVHYERRMRSHRPPVGPPKFLFDVDEGSPEVIDLPVDPSMAEILELEAGRNRVTVEEMLAHVLLIYLADMDRASQQSVAGVSIV